MVSCIKFVHINTMHIEIYCCSVPMPKSKKVFWWKDFMVVGVEVGGGAKAVTRLPDTLFSNLDSVTST